ncbi:MAG: metal ABC transporter ATP-binding protein [Eubacteriales bacterium]
MSEAILTCSDVTLGYEGQAVCRKIHFTLNEGDCLCVVGGSGSGKSTLLRVLMGEEAPMEGTVSYENGMRKNDIGCLPQVRETRRDASVRDVVMTGCLHRGRLPFFTKDDRQIVSERLHLVGIADLEKRKFSELSGGMQQKVLLARALCAAKKLLLLDHPAHGLDRHSADEMYDLIETVCMAGMTVVMVSDDSTPVLRLATHILHLAAEPRFYGTREAYLRTYEGKLFEAGVIL